MSKEMILQEDDCAPDALEHFEMNFMDITKMTIREFKTHKDTRHTSEDLFDEYENGDYTLVHYGDEGYALFGSSID